MTKTIAKKVYDTATAKLVKKVTFGYWGEAIGYEESLFQAADGTYFLYVNGGADSKYPKEDIKKMTKANAEKFIADNG